MPVVAETEFEGSSKPEKDAKSRIGCFTSKRNHEIHTAIALVAPLSAKTEWKNAREVEEKLLDGAPLLYAAVTKDDILPGLEIDDGIVRWPSKGYIEGDVGELSDFAIRVATPTSYVNKLSNRVCEELIGLGEIIKESFPVSVRRSIAESINQPVEGCEVVVLCVWLNAFVLYRRISTVHSELDSLEKIREAQSRSRLLLRDVLQAWNQILCINYTSVFLPAIESIKNLSEAGAATVAEILGRLDNLSETIESEPTGPLFDIGSEIFPKLAANRKETAAFYTLPETAELLASIACPVGKPEFSLADGRIGDFACGTGTLLRAVYHKIQTQNERRGIDPEVYHKRWMEDGIFGLDIQPIATHLTVSGLTGVFSRKTYGKSRIACISARDGKVGSLELLGTDTIIDLFGEEVSVGDKEGANMVTVEDNSFDLVIMNPPYSRTRGKQSMFDQDVVSDRDRSKSQQRLERLLRNSFGNKTAGLASAFAVLADIKLKPGGVFASVLPLSAASTSRWKKFREKMVRDYRDIKLVGLASKKLQSFSHDTDMGEMLLVARKALDGEKMGEDIKVLNLYCLPSNIAEAAEIARSFERALASRLSATSLFIGEYGQTENEVGELHCLPIEHDNPFAPWGAVGNLNSNLGQIARSLTRGNIRWPGEHKEKEVCQMTTIQRLFRVGPTHDLIGHINVEDGRGAYTLLPLVEGGSIPARLSLWAADGKVQTTMEITPTHKVEGVEGREDRQDSMWGKRSDLFWSKGLRWTSQALQSARTQRECMGGRAWVALLHHDEMLKKLGCLWGNSIFGLITRWWHAPRTQAGRAGLQIEAVSSMPIPDFSDLSKFPTLRKVSIRKKIDNFFERHCKTRLRAASYAWIDVERQKIDQIVAEVLEINEGGEREESLRELRLLWCSEPSVHGGNDAILKLLKDCAK